jgi:selenocysteine lyase/cysteine desulfurase
MNGLTNHGFPTGTESFASISQEDLKYVYKDAVFLSPHKLVGGPGSSGVLLAKSEIIKNSKPLRLGGGIVFFVTELEHEFLPDK